MSRIGKKPRLKLLGRAESLFGDWLRREPLVLALFGTTLNTEMSSFANHRPGGRYTETI